MECAEGKRIAAAGSFYKRSAGTTSNGREMNWSATESARMSSILGRKRSAENTSLSARSMGLLLRLSQTPTSGMHGSTANGMSSKASTSRTSAMSETQLTQAASRSSPGTNAGFQGIG